MPVGTLSAPDLSTSSTRTSATHPDRPAVHQSPAVRVEQRPSSRVRDTRSDDPEGPAWPTGLGSRYRSKVPETEGATVVYCNSNFYTVHLLTVRRKCLPPVSSLDV